jgi:hypothetical protein
MSSRTKVQEYAIRARNEIAVDKKLNAIADAIHEFVNYMETLEPSSATLKQKCGGWGFSADYPSRASSTACSEMRDHWAMRSRKLM